MAADHLVVDFANDVRDREAALFGSDLGVKHDLQEKVAQLLGELGVIAAVQGFEDLVGFFDEISAKRPVRLFTVPGTAFGRAQPGLNGHELFEPIPRRCRRFPCQLAASWFTFPCFLWLFFLALHQQAVFVP